MTTGQRPALVPGLVLVLAVALAAGCTHPRGNAHNPSALPAGDALPQARMGTPRVLAQGLEVPWGVAFLPQSEGGGALVGERDSARLLRIDPSGAVHQIGRVPGVVPRGEGGLLGLAVASSFARDRLVYAYYTATSDNRIVRFRYQNDGRLGPQEVLVSGIPRGNIHNGGRLVFGPDGMLYAGVGEAGNRGRAQDLSSLGGKILRLTPDGKPAPGNPFSSLVWSYGHRNVQGLAFGPAPARRLYATEFGQDNFDEINLIQPGRDYGWPTVEGFADAGPGGSRYANPLLTWTPDQASPSGEAIAGGSIWVACLRGERLWRVPLGSDGRVGAPEALFAGQYGRLRTVVAAPDGTLWLTTSNRDGRGNPKPGDDQILVLPLG